LCSDSIQSVEPFSYNLRHSQRIVAFILCLQQPSSIQLIDSFELGGDTALITTFIASPPVG
jgi:hypothetical protein